MDELIDIVDENDKVIGQELKSTCHKEKILHRSANILVFKDDSLKEILLQKRSMQKKSLPKKICMPGGHLQPDETYLEGAKREFFEEMYDSNNDTSKFQFEELFKIKKFVDEDFEFTTVFRTVAKGPFTPDSTEVESYFFENIKETLKKLEEKTKNYTQTTILLIKKYKKDFM